MKKNKNFVCCLFSIFFFSVIGYSQTAGSLDLSFGNSGYVISDFENYDDWGFSVVVQPDGKIVVAGEASDSSGSNFGIIRYNIDGSYDNTFGTAGKVTTSIGNSNDYAYALELQSDGKIVVAGTTIGNSTSDAAVVRYNSDGTLDNTFGIGGIATFDINGTDDNIRAMTIQQDGKILLAGYSFVATYSNFVVLRCNANGTLDNSFGTGGISLYDIGNSDNGALTIALQSNQKVLVAGWSNNGSFMDYDFAIARLNINGTLDTSFGTSGFVITSVGTSMNEIYDIDIQSDGKIVAAGPSNNVYNDFAVVRYNADGTLDNTFGVGGIVTTDVGGSSDVANAITLQADGKIIVAGYAHNGSTYNNSALVRYNTNGTLDNTFGTNGKSITTIGIWDNGISAIVLQPDGKIVTTGLTTYGGDNEITLARFIGNGSVGFYSCLNKDLIMMYPNPATDKITISIPVKATLEISDVNGQIIQTINSSGIETTIDLRNISSGVYVIKAKTDKEIVTKKFIKQ